MSTTLLPPRNPPRTPGAETLARSDPWVHRFGRTERFAHWWVVLTLLVAILSGLGMGDDGGSGPVLLVHVGAVVMMAAGLAATLLFGNHRAVFAAGRQLFSLNGRDIAWLRGRARHPLRGTGEPAWGMFNAGQKLLAWSLTVSVTAVIVTGIQSWSAGGEGGLHGTTVLLTLVLLGAHIFMAVINPSTRPALAGMVFGRVRRSWAAKHHPEWLWHQEHQRERRG